MGQSEMKGSMMPDITREITIKAAPARVFTAVTRHDEITQWWANQVTAEPTIGSIAEFCFNNGEVMRMKIADLVVDKSISWLVRDAPQYAHLWEGTTITWHFAPAAHGTQLRFAHGGFAVVDSGYEQTRTGWEYFLESLKSYLETGHGTPYVYASAHAPHMPEIPLS